MSIKHCVFSTKEQSAVDNSLAALYKSYGKRCPFGDFRASWWRYHCQKMGGAEFCPYPPRDCALAFFRVAALALPADKPGAMFRVIAKDHAIKRLERKPLARETQSRTPFTRIDPRSMAGAEGQSSSPRPDSDVSDPAIWDPVGMGEAGQSLRRPISRPVRIGTLLGSVDTRPRQVPADDGKEASGQ